MTNTDGNSQSAREAMNEGLLLAREKKLPDALRCFEKALALCEQAGDTIGMAEQRGNIGTVYRDLDQPARAIENYQQALNLYRRLDHRERCGDQLTNIGYALVMQNAASEALWWYREGLACYTAAGVESKVRSTSENIDRLEDALGLHRSCNC